MVGDYRRCLGPGKSVFQPQSCRRGSWVQSHNGEVDLGLHLLLPVSKACGSVLWLSVSRCGAGAGREERGEGTGSRGRRGEEFGLPSEFCRGQRNGILSLSHSNRGRRGSRKSLHRSGKKQCFAASASGGPAELGVNFPAIVARALRFEKMDLFLFSQRIGRC